MVSDDGVDATRPAPQARRSSRTRPQDPPRSPQPSVTGGLAAGDEPAGPSMSAEPAAQPSGPGGPQQTPPAAGPRGAEILRGAQAGTFMSAELIAGIGTWMVIGWLADRWLGTDPWLMVIGALVGFAGGLTLIWLRSERDTQADLAAAAARRTARDG